MKKFIALLFLILMPFISVNAAFTVPQGGTGVATLSGLVVGNGTASFSAITTSAGLAGVISNETGSGSLVFATSPTLITPVLGVATGTSITTSAEMTASDFLLSSGGSATDPSFRTTGDPELGIYFTGTTTVGFAQGGATMGTISNSGFQIGAVGARVTQFDNDNTLAANSATRSVTQAAVKGYADAGYRPGGTDVALADGGTGTSLSDPNANTALVWDDTTNTVRLATYSGLSYNSGTNVLTASGGGGSLTVGTSPITSGTATRLLFEGSGNVLQEDSALVWNSTSDYLGIGATPDAALTVSAQSTIVAPVSGSLVHLVGLDANSLRLTLDTHNNAGAGGTAIMFRRSRGTAGTPSATQANDTIGSLNAVGYGTSQYATVSTGLISIKANEAFTNTANGTYIALFTTPDGSVTAAESARFASDRLRVGVAGTMLGKMDFAGNTSGNITVQGAAVGGTSVNTLQAVTDTFVYLNTTDTLTNKSLTSPLITNLTAGRVTFAGTSGLLTDDADMTFATDTLTATKMISNSFVPNATTVPTNGLYLPAANTLGWAINSAAEMQLTSTMLAPAVNVGSSLGNGTFMWANVFIGSAGQLTFNNGDVSLVHANNLLTFQGATNGYAFQDGPIRPTVNDGTAIGSTTLQWSDLFLASGGVINFANGNAAITHSTGVLTVSAGDLRVTSANVGSNADSVPTLGSISTLTNKRVTARTGTVASSGTPTINTDTVDFYSVTAQSAAITSFTTNLTGTPTDGQILRIAITDNGTPRTITWGASFEASGAFALPATTVISTRLDVMFIWNTVTSKWRCILVS